jgi:hypothetical protein
MGCRYENKLDEERDRAYWQNAPWWHKFLTCFAYLIFAILAFWGNIGWLIAKLFGW